MNITFSSLSFHFIQDTSYYFAFLGGPIIASNEFTVFFIYEFDIRSLPNSLIQMQPYVWVKWETILN